MSPAITVGSVGELTPKHFLIIKMLLESSSENLFFKNLSLKCKTLKSKNILTRTFMIVLFSVKKKTLKP